MGKIINLDDYRKKPADSKIVQQFKDSLDNKSVKERYGINEMSEDERFRRIQERIKRINTLMRELEANNK